MSNLSDLSRMIQATTATLSRMQRAAAHSQESRSLSLSIASLEQRLHDLEGSFLAEADQLGVEVCSYRVFGAEGQPTAISVGQALESFQAMVSTTYAAVKSGSPRKGGRVGEKDLQESEFKLAYAFPGSVGFVLTLPNKRLLMGESKLDEAMEEIVQIASAGEPKAIAKFVKRLGPAPIRAVHRWSKSHTDAGLGAAIDWQRNQEILTSVFLDAPEMDRLCETIEATGEATSDEVRLSGMLVGLHSERGTFDLILDNGSHIRGTLKLDVSEDRPAKVPARYSTVLTKTTRIRFATDDDEVVWVLDSLEPV